LIFYLFQISELKKLLSFFSFLQEKFETKSRLFYTICCYKSNSVERVFLWPQLINFWLIMHRWKHSESILFYEYYYAFTCFWTYIKYFSAPCIQIRSRASSVRIRHVSYALYAGTNLISLNILGMTVPRLHFKKIIFLLWWYWGFYSQPCTW
jgi:hypothetical protein